MFKQSKITSTVSQLILCGCLLVQTQANAFAEGYVSNIRGVIGHKSLDSGDWPKLNSQGEFGLLYDLKKKEWPVSIAIDLFISGTSSGGSDTEIDFGYTVEQHLGVRKTWTVPNSSFHPYVGGGVAIVLAGFEQLESAGGAKKHDSTVGLWAGVGGYWDLTPSINLGLDIRHSQAKVTVFDRKIEAGGTHAGLTVGYNW